MTTYETISLITNCSLFGIRFFWDYARRFLKYPVSELIGDYVFLEELWGSEAEFIVEEIKSADGISEMIERRRTFQKELGVSPKELLDILRFQCLLRELYKGIPSRFTDIALKYGYYDQSYFINNFKRFYGLAPGQVFK